MNHPYICEGKRPHTYLVPDDGTKPPPKCWVCGAAIRSNTPVKTRRPKPADNAQQQNLL